MLDGVEWIRPRPDRRGLHHDIVLAVVLLACTIASSLLYRAAGIWEQTPPLWGSLIWAAAMTLPLAARRIAPEIVAGVLTVAFMVGAVTQAGDLLFNNIGLFIAIYSVGAWSRHRRAAQVVRGVIVVVMLAWLFWDLIVSAGIPERLPGLDREGGVVSPYVAFALINIITNLLYFGGAWFFGDTAYRSARSRTALEQRTAELAAERERTRAQAVAIERLRIARELHDVVAHHVSVIGVQAGAARRVLGRDPEQAAESLAAIEQSAREAVAELHGLLGTLREGSADASGAGPEPAVKSIADLPALIEDARAGGLPADITVVGEPRETSGLVAVTAYRLVQESLTNVRKHAGASAAADVRLRWSDAALEIEIADTGIGAAGRVPTGARATDASAPGGLGLVGMRERVAASGGTFEAGPRHRGGFLVRATLPLRRTGSEQV